MLKRTEVAADPKSSSTTIDNYLSLAEHEAAHDFCMNKITLNLVVLRSTDIARAATFYTRLGLQFTKHRHGKGAEHFAAELPGPVFELYTQTDNSPTTLAGLQSLSTFA